MRVVEGLKASMGVISRACVRQACTACRTLLASTLPSSTPHWSKLLMPQMKPCPRPGARQAARQQYVTPQSSPDHIPY